MMHLPDILTQDADGFIHLTGHRIGLRDVVELYNDGYSPEMLACQFPTLSLALIHKILAFYLENRAAADVYIAAETASCEQQRAAAGSSLNLQQLRRRLGQIQTS